MSNETKFAKYRNFPPAKVVASDMRGHKVYLYLVWNNVKGLAPRWVRAKDCDFHTPDSQKKQENNPQEEEQENI